MEKEKEFEIINLFIESFFELNSKTRQTIITHFKEKLSDANTINNNFNKSPEFLTEEKYIKLLKECTEKGIYCLEFHRRQREKYKSLRV